MSQIKKNTDQYMNNLKLQLKLSEMGIASWSSPDDPLSGFKREANRVINTQYDREMIDAYMDEQNKPIEINGKKYQYEPIEADIFDEIPQKLLDDLDEINRKLSGLNDKKRAYIKKLKAEYDYSDFEKLKSLISKDKLMIEAERNSPAPKKMLKEAMRLTTNERKLTKMTAENQDLHDELDRIIKEEEALTKDLNDLKDQGKKIDDSNIQKLNDYKENNKKYGKPIPDPMPGENNDDYIRRVNENADVTGADSDYTKTKAYLNNIEQFKNNFKELTRNEIFIQQVLNTIQTLGTDPEGILFKLNQKFPIFKKDYLKVYGFNNNNVSLNDIADIIVNFVADDKLPSWSIAMTTQPQLLLNNPTSSNLASTVAFGMTPGPFTFSPSVLTTPLKRGPFTASLASIFQPSPPKGTPYDSNEIFIAPNEVPNTFGLAKGDPLKVIYLCWAAIPRKSGKPKEYVCWSPSGLSGSWQTTNSKPNNGYSLFTVMHREIGITEDQYKSIGPGFGSTSKSTSSQQELVNDLKQMGLTDNYDSSTNPLTEVAKVGTSIIYGFGIKANENIHKVIHFGLVCLFLHKLYYKNILSIQNQKGLKIAGFKNTPVSDAFVNCVMKVIDHKDLTASDIHSLKSSEKELFDNLLHIAGLHKKNITGSTKDSIETVKKRLELVEGEIEAGNNNTELKRELYDLLFRLVHFHVISEKQARSHYKLILKQFFDK